MAAALAVLLISWTIVYASRRARFSDRPSTGSLDIGRRKVVSEVIDGRATVPDGAGGACDDADEAPVVPDGAEDEAGGACNDEAEFPVLDVSVSIGVVVGPVALGVAGAAAPGVGAASASGPSISSSSG